jgi:hypothetical protein
MLKIHYKSLNFVRKVTNEGVFIQKADTNPPQHLYNCRKRKVMT